MPSAIEFKAVDKEAGTALGLTGAQSMRFVVLPQALRNMIPRS